MSLWKNTCRKRGDTMSNINASNLQIDWEARGNDEIRQNVRVILTTVAGTVPFDRDFGISLDPLDAPLELAKAKLTVDFINKVRKYEPRAEVKKVTFEYDSLNGCISPKVVMGLVD